MKLRIEAVGTGLEAAQQERIEHRIRLIVGANSAGIEAARIRLAVQPDDRIRIRCRVKPVEANDWITLPEDFSESIDSVVEMGIWRLRRFVDRRALRNAGFAAPLDATTPRMNR